MRPQKPVIFFVWIAQHLCDGPRAWTCAFYREKMRSPGCMVIHQGIVVVEEWFELRLESFRGPRVLVGLMHSVTGPVEVLGGQSGQQCA